MARPLSSSEHADAARRLLKEARTAYEMRLAQSLLLPLELGLTLEQTARAIGRSIGSTSVMRSSFEKKASRLAASIRLPSTRLLPGKAATAGTYTDNHLQYLGGKSTPKPGKSAD